MNGDSGRRVPAVLFSITLCLLAAAALAQGESAPAQAGFRVGQSFSGKSNINAYAVTLRQNWLPMRALGSGWQWGIDREYAIAEWQTDVPDQRNYNSGRDETLVASVSPVFRISKNKPFRAGMVPFCEAGIGVAYFQHKKLAAYDYSEGDLGSHLQFEDRLTLGFAFPRYRDLKVCLSIFHYSNANLGDANDGINLRALSVHIPL